MQATSSSVICILNSSAGTHSGQATSERLIRMFTDRNTQVSVWVADSGTELAALSHRAISEKHSLVVACGGDGTISCVAAALAGTDTPLGVLPLGTLNHFAKDLNIPLDIEEAVDTIATGREKIVDVGEVNGRIFINNCSLGLYPRIVREREKLQSVGNSKWIAFVRAIAFVFLRYSRLHVRLDTGNPGGMTRTTPFVFIGNNKYQTEGWNIGTRAKLDAGRLWLYMAPRRGPGGLIILALRALFGQLNGEIVDAFETQECWIETGKKRLDVATDGEVTAMDTPLHYRIRPGALRVMVPATAASTDPND